MFYKNYWNIVMFELRGMEWTLPKLAFITLIPKLKREQQKSPKIEANKSIGQTGTML